MDNIKNKIIKQKNDYKTLHHVISNIKRNKKEKNIKTKNEILKKNYKIKSNSQNANILKIINLNFFKNMISSNILIITLIVILYPIIIFNKNINELRRLYSFSEITLKIKGTGNKYILSNTKDDKGIYFNITPSEVYVNDIIQKPPGFKATLTKENSTVKIRWNYTLTNCSLMFYKLDNILEIDLSNFDSSQVTSTLRMFQDCSSLTSINLNNFNTKYVKDMRNMFAHCTSLISLDLSNFDTSSVTKMDSLFYNCSLLKSLDLSNFDTSKVTSMGSMFYTCKSLTSLDLNNFDTSSVKDMSNMFKDCSSLKYLDIDNFDTSSVTNMDRMFSGCRNLTSLNVRNFQTSKVTNMNRMFFNCRSITSLDLNNFETSLVSSMLEMFNNCASLVYLSIDYFDTSQVANMTNMFYNCKSLISLNLTNFRTTNSKSFTSMFTGCSNNLIFCMNETRISKIVKELNSTNPNFTNNCSEINSIKNNLIINKNEKNNVCNTIDFLSNICKIDNNKKDEDKMIDNIRNEIIEESLDSLLDNIFTGEKNDILVEDQKIIYQLTSSDNQNNKKYYNVSTIKLGECEKELKEYYKMGDNGSLLIFKVDYYDESSTTPIVEYEIYDFENKRKLNLSICQNIPIEIDIPASIDEDNIFKYNLSSEYYNDRCYPYTTEQGTDIILSDRKNEYYQNNMTLCEENCDYNGYDNETKRAICKCKIKETFLSISEINFDKDKLIEFFNLKNRVNIYVMKCYQLLFSKDGIIQNIGSYILLFIILANIPLLIIFKVKEYHILNKMINDLIKTDGIEKNKINKKENKWTNKKNIIKTTKMKLGRNSLKNIFKTTKIFKKLKDKIKNNPPKYKKSKANIYSNESKTIDYISGKSMRRISVKDESNLSYISKKLNLNNNINNIKNKKNEIKKLNDYELNNLNYQDALEIDKRTYIDYYISLLKRKQILIFTFYTKDDYNSEIIKISLLLFSFSLYFTVNTLFFSDSTMHEIYEDKGSFDFLYQIPQILYSTIISGVNNTIVSYLSLSEKNILKIKKAKENNEDDINNLVIKTKKCLIIKFVIFFILNFFFLIFFWYYISCFCAVYKNTQTHLIKDTLISYLVSLLYPLGINLLPGIFRIPALNAKNKDKESIYKFSKIIQLI